jgi:hypothetical protein
VAASPEPSSGSPIQRSLADATRRIQGIIDAAERAADEIRADAEDAAQSYLVEKRDEVDRLVEDRAEALRELVRSLVSRAEELRGQAQDMAREVETMFAGLTDIRADEPASGSKKWTGPKPVAYAGTNASERASGDQAQEPPEEAVLRATQLAVAGSGRVEIEEALRREFGLEQPTGLVDDILGPSQD